MKLAWTFWVVFAIGGAFGASLWASKSDEPSSEQKLQQLNRQMAQEKYLSAQVEKTTVLQLLARTQKATGEIHVHQGKVRLELKAPEKSLLVVNKKEAWVVTYPPEDFPDAPVEAVVSQLAGASPNLGIAKVLSGEGIFEVFKVTKVELKESERKYSLEPRKSATEFQRGVLITDAEVEKIKELVYWDNLGNQVSYKFSQVKFSDQKPSESLFTYQPAAGVNVTRL